MCEFNPKNDSRKIDPCMKKFIENLNVMIAEPFKILACCCGHGKYPMTILVKAMSIDNPIEIRNGKVLSRKKKFYKKDKQGYYYIPEVCEEKK